MKRDEWETVTWSSVLEIKNGKDYKAVANENGAYPIYGSGGRMGYADSYICPEDTTIIGRKGSINKPIYVSEKFWNVDTAFGLVAKKEVLNPKFLYYFCVQYNFEKHNKTVTIPSLTKADLLTIKLPLPPLDVQRRIAETLDKVTELISLRKTQLEKLDELMKARFVEMFGTIYDNKFDFDIQPIQNLCEPIKDGTHQTPTYTEDNINGFKFLSSKNVTTGKIDWGNIKYIPENLHRELYAKLAPKMGDILLAKNGTTGISAIVDREEIFDIYVSLALIRPINMNSIYMWAALNSTETKQQFNAGLKGIGVPNLHLNEIKKTRIINPPLSLQNSFASFVSSVEETKAPIQQSLDTLETLKKSLMQEYFG